MSQTTIDLFFKTRKRSARELEPFAKTIKRQKLFTDIVRELSNEVEEQNVEIRDHVSILTSTRSVAERERFRKELNLGEFKKLVRQSRKYTTLKTNIEKYNATVSSLKRIEHSLKNHISSPELKKFSDVELEVHSSYRPIKRYQQLLADCEDLLVLPSKYVTLNDIFNAVESVVKIPADRKELVTLRRIRNDVQKMTRRNFTEEHMAMIKTIYPDAYELKYEFVKLPVSCETLELVVEASQCTDMTTRKKIFENLLLEETKCHHQEFLKTLDPPLIVPAQQIRRWHPFFDLNGVPDIPLAPLPRPAVNEDAPVLVEKFVEKTKQLVSCNKPVEPRSVLQSIEGKLTPEVEKKIRALQKSLKGVPKSLFEKIRAKKAAKMGEAITETPGKAKEEAMSCLPVLP